MNQPLTINEIKQWLKENSVKYHELKQYNFPPSPFDIEESNFYSTYNNLLSFINDYNRQINICNSALTEIIINPKLDFHFLKEWVNRYKDLGNDLILFDGITYLWDEHKDLVRISNGTVRNNKTQIYEGIYTYKSPFLNMLCFCKVFQMLYWDYQVNENTPTKEDGIVIIAELKEIVKENYKK